MKKIIIVIVCVYSQSLLGQCFPDRHSTNWFDAWISCSIKENPNTVNKPSHWILYDLRNEYQIDKIKIWNVNDPDHLEWGFKDVKIDYSTDSITWNNAGSFVLDKASGNNRYEGMDWLDVVIPKAKFILFTALTNYGGMCAGLSELRFSAEKIKVTTEVADNSEKPSNWSVTVLPNPFNELMRIEFENCLSEPIHIRISDLLGKSIFSQSIDSPTEYQSLKINTRKWSSGAYQLYATQSSITKRLSLIKI